MGRRHKRLTPTLASRSRPACYDRVLERLRDRAAMKSVAVGVLLACVAGSPAVVASRDQDPQFRAGVHTVSVYATVFDAAGRLVPNLTEGDFEVFDDGVRQPITQFENAIQPITVVLLLDRSTSVWQNFDLEREGAERFVAELLDADRARVGSFNGMIRIEPAGFTSDRNELIRSLHLDLLDAGVTPLWNATSAAMNALAQERGRRVVILFTDGYDNPALPGRNTVTFGDVRNRSRVEGIMVYGVGLMSGCAATDAPGARRDDRRSQRGYPAPPSPPPPASPLSPPGTGPMGPGISVPINSLFGNRMWEGPCAGNSPSAELKDIASDSGGGYFDLLPTADLGTSFARLADELHHTYLLGLTTTKLDGRSHSLEVRVRDPKMSVRARKTYVATAGG
jgi:VWFA-related protein